MIIILDHWARRWQALDFDTDSGTGRIRWLSRKPQQCNGFAQKLKGVWYARWLTRDYEVFQAGGQKWPMTREYNCRNVPTGSNRTFSIHLKDRTLFELTYSANLGGDDPTFDEFDLMNEDFFYWVAAAWNAPDLETVRKASCWGVSPPIENEQD